MPRRRVSRTSSSEHSTHSDQSENLNISDELPDPGLPKRNGKEVKEKKRVSFNFPVEVITKDGKFTGMGTIDLMETSTPSPDHQISPKPRKTKAELKEIVYDLTQDEKVPEPIKNQTTLKNQDVQKNHVKSKTQEPVQKQIPAAVTESVKQPVAKKKETAKEAREAKKKETAALRESIKKSIEDEKRAKAEFDEINKIFKPGECLKHINIEVHPELDQQVFSEALRQAARALGVKMQPSDDLEPGLLVWTRTVPPALLNEGGMVKLGPCKAQCDLVFYIVVASELLELAAAGRACAHVALRRERLGPCRKVTLVVYGVADMLKSLPQTSNGGQRMTRDRFANAIADIQMELMVEQQVDLVVVESPAVFASLLTHYTMAIAEAPFKKAKREIDEQADFYMRGDNKNCVTVDKDGNGLSRLWEQMIATLPMSSLEVARTLGGTYKTPRALTQELMAVGGLAKIADIGVTRANVPGAKSRRLGPEFARKLQILFTSEDENAVIE